MFSSRLQIAAVVAALAAGATGCAGQSSHCSHHHDYCGQVPPPPPLGHLIDPVFQEQEANAEATDFAIAEHEFKGNSAVLNQAGEEHVKRIAVRAGTVPFPIIIQPSSMSFENEEPDVFEYPIHNDRDLDLQRREIVVAALARMGVHDAEQRVVVAPLFDPGFESFEAEGAYLRGFASPGFNYGQGYGLGGFGGFGGGGGFGGIGGFGGGFGFF